MSDAFNTSKRPKYKGAAKRSPGDALRRKANKRDTATVGGPLLQALVDHFRR